MTAARLGADDQRKRTLLSKKGGRRTTQKLW